MGLRASNTRILPGQEGFSAAIRLAAGRYKVVLRIIEASQITWGTSGDVPLTAPVGMTIQNGFTISQPEIAAKWQEFGGPSGSLGALTGDTKPTQC
ncbi:MAG: hypothetical protein ACRD0C_15500, partial [Acidimicrobiia bacterium]